MKLSAEARALQDRLGHVFRKPELLARALTHPSIASETRPSNQRLEFLGDRVLNLVIAEALFLHDRLADEGQLAPRYNVLVRKETCADVARQIDLGAALKLGRSEMMSGGRRKNALLGDAMEAVLAAIYLDGGLEAAKPILLRLWGDRIEAAEALARDSKTALQEWAQARGMKPPSYVQTGRSGPDHAPNFTIAVKLEDGRSETATAGSKRQAEQLAATALLARLESGES
ncbi:ribonuclease III [Tropicimonas sp. TH_r6]|uniref:ribonuclease III n=1 Tax=Tropicimonas sp. TH_r6 TaxID=3082085 RepID=UPI002952F457|nr:ribonuclease III [Tropicimonas sp. TH_r6]MDV7142123.1 ribonuclease III [Tropicimonas sp. TH_r6]